MSTHDVNPLEEKRICSISPQTGQIPQRTELIPRLIYHCAPRSKSCSCSPRAPAKECSSGNCVHAMQYRVRHSARERESPVLISRRLHLILHRRVLPCTLYLSCSSCLLTTFSACSREARPSLSSIKELCNRLYVCIKHLQSKRASECVCIML
jgi:hypothetical protein